VARGDSDVQGRRDVGLGRAEDGGDGGRAAGLLDGEAVQGEELEVAQDAVTLPGSC
jgi:hypothetical protein